MARSIRLHPKYGVNPTIPVCFFCGKERGELVLLGAAYKGEAPMKMCMDKTPCKECKEYMSLGVMLVSVQDNSEKDNPFRTGCISVIKTEAAEKLGIKGRFAFIEDSLWDKLGLPRENYDGRKE